MTVTAPFRFAPIHRWVHSPDWASCVSHDVPFEDGLSGEVQLEIEATTPLLVGGARHRSSHEAAGEVWPYRLPMPDGRYAIPPSTLQGLIRSILEVASFGKLGPMIEERRFAYRDLAPGATANEFYKSRMTSIAGGVVTQHARSGWLIDTREGPIIVPCEYARIEIEQIRGLKQDRNGPRIMTGLTDAKARYEWFCGDRKEDLNRRFYVDAKMPHAHQRGAIRILYSKAFTEAGAGRSNIAGTLVLTGGAGRKHMEFVFHSPSRPSALDAGGAARFSVPRHVWRDFQLSHEAQPGGNANPNWDYWKSDFKNGAPVPIFYLTDPANRPIGAESPVTTIGTAFMFKAAMPLSTHELLDNSSEKHRSADPDLPTLIFGDAAEKGAGLKRRGAFDIGICEDATLETTSLARAILLSPKPSYFPIYVRQPGANGQLDNWNWPYAVYASSKLHREQERVHPELAGVKIWPARNRVCEAGYPPELENNRQVQTTLNGVPVGAAFTTTFRFHNLKPVELGAILWALSFGAPEAWSPAQPIQRRHRLGMGKPYGFGEVTIRIGQLSVAYRAQPPQIASLIDAFVEHMSHVYAESGDRGGWKNSVQVRSLLKAADPMANQAADHFNYMGLGGQGAVTGTYTGERAANRYFLRTYETGGEVSRHPAAMAAIPVLVAIGEHRIDIDGDGCVITGPGNQPGHVMVRYDGANEDEEVALIRLRRP